MRLLITILLSVSYLVGAAQTNAPVLTGPVKKNTGSFVSPVSGTNGSLNISRGFIENIGQFSGVFKGAGNGGKLLYGYHAPGMAVMFTTKGFEFLQRKLIEKKEKSGDKETGEEKHTAIDRNIVMEWLGANTNPEISAEGLSTVYHTYGTLSGKARVYHTLTLKQLYPGIDVEYSLSPTGKPGFQYKIIVHPGADASEIKMLYSGDITTIKHDTETNLLISSDIGTITATAPVCFYDTLNTALPLKTKNIGIQTKVTGKTISFVFPVGYDRSRKIIIDPFVSALPPFTGLNNDKAYDIDYDYDGNVYAKGGGDIFFFCELAKFDPTGNLLWVFHGNIPGINWSFIGGNGGWAVERNTGKIYAGQGSNTSGAQVIRLNASGVYDNYISNGNSAYPEIWKMIWQCNGGTPFYFAGGGSFTSNLQFGVLTPPAANLTVSNITGIPTFQLQDIADIVVDPQTNALYTIFTSSEPQLSALNNRIFRHKPPYTASDIVWSVPSGYQVLVEASNRPYLSAMNSVAINALAINASYLFYWDGRNLKAFDKNTGAVAGAPLTIPGNTALMQGGIATDTCNNVFVGDVNGTIKVYQFDGATFNDAAAPDIIVPGNPAATTYALVYDNWRKNIYAAGTGYVASINVAQYCLPAGYSINLNANCTAASIAATLSPAPPAGSVITYSLYLGAALIGTSTTGIFNGLLPNTNYTIVAIIDIACGGPRAEKTFSLSTPVISLSATPATCTQNIGAITVTAASAATSYTYSIDGVQFQASNVFSSLSAGSYTISVKNDIGCIVTDTVTVPLSGTNTVTLSVGANATICEGESTVLGATSNAATFLWTPTTGLNNPNIPNPVASPLVTTKYYIKATTAFCSKTDSVTVLVNPAPVANAGNSVTICFGKDTTLNGSGGVQYSWLPATYLNNPGIANPNVLRPAQSITYQLQVTDNRGCRSTNPATVTVTVRPREQLFAGNDTAVPINQALQLNAIDVNATGFINYLWTPAYGLSNPNIKNPVALPDRDITYTVEASTANDCRTSAVINITVYLKPEIYVPGAFTPNKDGINDVLKAVPTGIKVFRYFAVYNRYGQRVFYTKNAAVGWDGKVKGSNQDNSSYAWMAEGIDYQGKIIKRKGTSILIR